MALKGDRGREADLRIRVARPVAAIDSQPVWLEKWLAVVRPIREIADITLESGPACIESRYGEALAVCATVERMV